VPGEPAADDAGGLRAANAQLRAIVETKDAQVAVLTAALEASLERERRLEVRLAEVERRLNMDSSDSGTPSSKERIGAKEARRARQQSERERSKDRRRGGQPGHPGQRPQTGPAPDDTRDVPPPAGCRSCRAPLNGAETADPRWAQVAGVEFSRTVTEWTRNPVNGYIGSGTK
jgi:transposase